MPRPVNEPGKGSYWTVDYAVSETERRTTTTRGKTRSSRSDSDPTPYPHHHHHHYRSSHSHASSSMNVAAAAAVATASPSWMSTATTNDTTRYQRSLSTSDASLYYQPFNYYGYQQYIPAPTQQRPTSTYNFAPARSYSYQYPNKASFYGVYNDHQQQSVPYHQADMSTWNHTMYQHPLQGMYNNTAATTTTTPTTPTATDPPAMPLISTPPLSDRSSVTTNGVLDYSAANFSSTPSLVTSPHLSVQESSQCTSTEGSKRTLDTCSDDLPVTPVPAKRHRRPS